MKLSAFEIASLPPSAVASYCYGGRVARNDTGIRPLDWLLRSNKHDVWITGKAVIRACLRRNDEELLAMGQKRTFGHCERLSDEAISTLATDPKAGIQEAKKQDGSLPSQG